MVRVDVVYTGQLHCEARHAPSSATLTTDAPLDNHGRGLSFSPTDLVATALGACMLTVMGITANQHGWDLDGATVTVEKEMTGQAPRRIARLQVAVDVPSELGTSDRKVLERAAHTCPVRLSILPAIDVPVTFRWGASRR